MGTPVISIVIVNYNYGRFLETAIKSVVEQQSFDQCELIIVDGGSSDESVEIIKKYQDKIVWWVSEKDKGQSDAFNKGFSHASGVFGCWVNADDLLLPGVLHDVIGYLKKNPKSDWIGGGVVWLDKDMKVTKCSSNTQLPAFLQRISPGFIVGGPSSFFRISIIKEIGGFDISLHYAMDNDLWLRMLTQGYRLSVLPRYLWTFRMHEASKTTMNLLPHDVSVLNEDRLLDGRLLTERYPINTRHEKVVSRIISIIKLLKGAYLKSFIDTIRYRNQPVQEVFK